MKKIKGQGYYWVFLCYGGVGDPLICGVFGSKKEAEDFNDEELKMCKGGHKIKRCKVEVSI